MNSIDINKSMFDHARYMNRAMSFVEDRLDEAGIYDGPARQVILSFERSIHTCLSHLGGQRGERENLPHYQNILESSDALNAKKQLHILSGKYWQEWCAYCEAISSSPTFTVEDCLW